MFHLELKGDRSPLPEVPESRDVRTIEEREPSGDDRVDYGDEHDRGSQGTRRTFRYEYSSSSSELNAVDCNYGMMDAIWATVDSGAPTSSLPLAMCKQMNLAIAKTSDLPYTTASGEPSVTLGTRGGAGIFGVGDFKAMDVAKPLLSVAKLVGKGWSVTFTPQGAYMSRKGVSLPIENRDGIYKIPLNMENQDFLGHRTG